MNVQYLDSVILYSAINPINHVKGNPVYKVKIGMEISLCQVF